MVALGLCGCAALGTIIMSGERDSERIESDDRSASAGGDAAFAEANAGKPALVDEQKAHTKFLKDGGRSGITDQFKRLEIIGSDEVTTSVALEGQWGQGASGTAFLGDTEDLAELILDKLEEAQDEDTDRETSERLEREAYELLKTVKTKEEMEALEEELEDEDTFRGIDFEVVTTEDGDLIWTFEGENSTYDYSPERYLKKDEDSSSKTLRSDEFDELGEDVAKALREMGVQRIEVTDLGDTKRVKLKLSDEYKIETGRDDVSAVSLGEEVELDLSVGDDGRLKVTNIDGISAKLAGTPAGVGINSLEVTTNENGEHIATVNAGPLGGMDHNLMLPDAARDRLFAVLERLK